MILSDFNSEKLWKSGHSCWDYRKNKNGTFLMRHGVHAFVDDSRNSPIAVVFLLQKSPPVILATLDHDRRQSVQVIVFSVNRL